MTFRTLIRRSLRHHRRSHLGVVIGAAIASAALIGALIVGDSVKGSLLTRALQRCGWVGTAMESGDRFFQADLDWRLDPKNAVESHIVSCLRLPATVVRVDGLARANQVNVLGIDSQFFWADSKPRYDQPDRSVILNEALAAQLGAGPGDEVLVRIRKPSFLSADAPMAPGSDESIALRLKVEAVAVPAQMGNFSLQSGGTEPLNAFVRLDELQNAMELQGKANLLLAGLKFNWDEEQWWRDAISTAHSKLPQIVPEGPPNGEDASSEQNREWQSNRLASAVTLADYEVEWSTNAGLDSLELSSTRVFIDAPIAEAVGRAANLNLQAPPFLNPASGELEPDLLSPALKSSVAAMAAGRNEILTYLANLITAGSNATPYSMVTAAGAPWTPPGMRDDEIVINQWLADDLQARPGDELRLVYFDPESGARLQERTNAFRIHSIVPMDMPWADRALMPPFPGIEKAETTAEWDTAFPLVHTIRPQDDDYWTQYRGTPKAFVTLAAGQRMWANRFGDLTAIRFPLPNTPGGTNSTEVLRAGLEKRILSTLKPEDLGFRFEPVLERAIQSAEQSQDFGGLFIGFSLFVIVAALLLMALLFQFGLEQRAAEVGTLLALGLTPRQVRRLFLGEGIVLALLGGLLGAVAGIAYARAMLAGLTTIWRDAVGTSTLQFFVTTQTLCIGFFSSALVAAIVLWLALRKQAKRPARELLAGEVGGIRFEAGPGPRRRRWIVGVATLVAALGLVIWTLARGDTANAGAFFGAGALVLIAGLSFLGALLSPRLRSVALLSAPTPRTLALRGMGRRRSRTVATAAMLASATFLIVSIGVFRLDANREANLRSSGTGGFALIGESTLPVVADLNTRAGWERFALDESVFDGVNVVQFRVRQGDEASCLNLNRAQQPRLLGVKTGQLEGRFTFKQGEEWAALHTSDSEVEVPAIGDAASIQWAMGKKVGDTLDYVDERGQSFKVRLVGAVANSVLQGQLIIDEAEFVKRFPGESGYKFFLLDAPPSRAADLSAKLTRAFQDSGLEVTPAAVRLAQFNAVQNTYLGTFQMLGGLGLLLGSAGLGIVVLRNVLERRGELAVLQAVGWPRITLRQLVLLEHGALLALGLLIGLLAAAIAVLPGLVSAGSELPWFTLVLTLALVVANGLLFAWVATRFALRGNLLAALRNE